MTRNVIPRQFDVDQIIKDYERRIRVLEHRTQQLGAGFDWPGGYDTGWVDRSGDLVAGFTVDGALESRRIGAAVWWRGRIAPNVNWGAAFTNNQVINDMGDEWTPAFSDVELNASGAATSDTYFRVVANATNGALQVRCSTATHTGSVYMTLRYLSGLAG